jgi:hypothetical protein
MISADGIDAVPGIGTGSVSLKYIARQAAHAAEREVILLVLERRGTKSRAKTRRQYGAGSEETRLRLI